MVISVNKEFTISFTKYTGSGYYETKTVNLTEAEVDELIKKLRLMKKEREK